VIFELQLGQIFKSFVKLTIVNSQFTKLPTVRFKKPNLAVMHTCSYCNHAHYKLRDDDNDYQIFCVFQALDLP